MSDSTDRTANFDRIARVYDWLAEAVFGDTLHTAQTADLEQLPADSEIAIFGGGSGRILEDIFATGKRFKVIYFVDSSDAMVALARTRLESISGQPAREVVQYYAQTAEQWCTNRRDSLDVIITPFFLDCFEGNELNGMISQLASLLRSGGQWWNTDFVPSPKFRHRLLMASMFQFFRFSCRLKSSRLEPYFERIGSEGLRELAHTDFETPAGPVRCQRFVQPKTFRRRQG